jgi:hypothetical protein
MFFFFNGFSWPWPLVQFRNHFSQTVGLLGREISPSQGRFLNTGQHKHRINAYLHPCLEWDSNPRSQRPSGRKQFMPYTARLLSPAVTICTTYFKIIIPCILPTECISVSRMVLTINSDCFPRVKVRAISLYSSRTFDKKEILRTVANVGVYCSCDELGMVYLL